MSASDLPAYDGRKSLLSLLVATFLTNKPTKCC